MGDKLIHWYREFYPVGCKVRILNDLDNLETGINLGIDEHYNMTIQLSDSTKIVKVGVDNIEIIV